MCTSSHKLSSCTASNHLSTTVWGLLAVSTFRMGKQTLWEDQELAQLMKVLELPGRTSHHSLQATELDRAQVASSPDEDAFCILLIFVSATLPSYSVFSPVTSPWSFSSLSSKWLYLQGVTWILCIFVFPHWKTREDSQCLPPMLHLSIDTRPLWFIHFLTSNTPQHHCATHSFIHYMQSPFAIVASHTSSHFCNEHATT